MEFPGLGQNCSQPSCKQLDFLPMKCDACSKVFCSNHFSYDQHSCPESYRKDNQVPVCPLCNTPIPVLRGETPDVKVGAHIDNDCQSDPAKEKRKKIYTNRCTAKGCKTKELIPFSCEKCRQNFCIRHRLESDHSCQGFQGSGRSISRAGAAAVSRVGNTSKAASSSTGGKGPTNRPQQSTLTAIGRDLNRERQERMMAPPARNIRAMQANMTEEEALAQAMALSLSDNQQPAQPRQQGQEMTAQEAEDFALAQAIAESEQMAANTRQRGGQDQNKNKSCLVS